MLPLLAFSQASEPLNSPSGSNSPGVTGHNSLVGWAT